MISDDVILCDTTKSSTSHKPQKGIQNLGQYNKKTGKLEALPEDVLASIVPQYDIVLMESDGSKGLPCKGWRENEPVAPDFCTHTIGVVSTAATGKAATSEVVHNLFEFLSLTGLSEGDIISGEAIVNMICSPAGMFKNSKGDKYLFVNHVEGKESAEYAKNIIDSIKKSRENNFKRLVYGSILNEQ